MTRLKQVRKMSKLKLIEVSEKTGLSVGALSNLENGKRKGWRSSKEILSDFYCLPQSVLFGDEVREDENAKGA